MVLRTVFSLLGSAVVVAAMLWVGAGGGPGTVARWLMPAALGAALFLLFLLLQGRHTHPLVQRIEEFQSRLLHQLARTPGALEADIWRSELERCRRPVEQQLAGGLVRGSRRGRRRAAALLEQAWEQVVAVMELRAGAEASAGQWIDGAELERLVLAAARVTVSTQREGGVSAPAVGAAQAAEASPAAPPMPAAAANATLRREAAVTQGRQAAPAAGAAAPATALAVYEAGTFAAAVDSARRSVAREGGVYRIREELYRYQRPLRPSLRQLAETASTEDQLDLLLATARRKERRIPVGPEGVRYDQLLTQYPDSTAATTRVRALEESCRSLNAAGAVLLVQEDAGYRAALAAGSLDSLAGTLTLAAGNTLYDAYLSARRYLIGGAPAADFAALVLAIGLPAAAAESIHCLALLPAILDATSAYLLFAGSTGSPGSGGTGSDAWDQTTLITGLNLYP